MGSPDVAVGLTSLEDVFLATAKKDEAGQTAGDSTWHGPSSGTENRIWQPVDDKKPSQMRAVLHLARLTTLMEYRTPRVIFFGNILPIIFILVGFVLSYLIDPKGSLESPPSLSLLPSATTLGSTGLFYVEGDAFNQASLGSPLQWTSSLPSGGDLLARYEDNGTLQYDPNVVSSLPMSISALTNSTLSMIPFPSISVSVTNDPLPYVKSYLIDVTQLLVPMFTMMGFIPYAYVVIRMAFWRADRIITQMKLMGMSVRLQYASLFVQRLIFGFLPAFVIILVAAGAFGSQLLGDGGRWLAYILLVITTFVALIPFAMMLAPLFKTGRQAGKDPTVCGDSSPLQFAVDRASKVVDSPVEWSDTFDPSNGVLTPIVVNVGVTIMSTLVVWYQTRDLTSKQMKKRKKYDANNEELPEAADLLEEAVLADKATQGIAVQNLTKIYPHQKKAAVKNLNIGVAPSEILVLLGPNGAGKTTTMKMLTGEEVPSAGIIKLGDSRDFEAAERGSLNFNSLYKRQVCGYCPQFDALFPELTVKEHLQLACTLKGLKTRSAISSHKAHVDAIVVALNLEPHLNTRSERLSGGNRRKLSLTLAVMGNPCVLFLDEPSTGMDPSAKRSVWKALRGEQSRPAMLMSTHYMDEATALSTRIGIMINGQMRVVGSVAELANRFSRDISIEASLRPHCSASELANALSFALGGADVSVIEDFNRSAILRVAVAHGIAPTEQIAELFRIMEGSLKERCGVIYYNLKLMSLEQIFINLVREQRE
ncbi:hypothetical protein FOL47_003044 [Perkinsus chesapeaki]|uniref:ABC transporter domain-containing protein n=1 Tax=Perkinsus chesapeaki TaxID=330153 RepID=A0A7J6M9Z4_PERCH|nr:hypothetical protein FOL47_003044 [Perkinsus chesapeaki]